MAIVALDDSDPIDAVLLDYRAEMRARRDEGAFWGRTEHEAVWQNSQVVDDTTTVRRKRKRLARIRKT
jgi:hypothetical protein